MGVRTGAEMRSLIPLTLYCISLLLFQQLLALPVGDHPERNRSGLLKKLHALSEEEKSFSLDVSSDLASPTDSSPPPALRHTPGGLPGFLRDMPPSNDIRAALANHALAWARGAAGSATQRRGSRDRRQVHIRGGNHHGRAQLMRVGCVLGTCQVQNLSHRLYQLIGQSGREDSSPINPRSPHSYG